MNKLHPSYSVSFTAPATDVFDSPCLSQGAFWAYLPPAVGEKVEVYDTISKKTALVTVVTMTGTNKTAEDFRFREVEDEF